MKKVFYAVLAIAIILFALVFLRGYNNTPTTKPVTNIVKQESKCGAGKCGAATTTDTVNSVKAKVQDITSSADATVKSSIDSVKEAVSSKCGAGKCGAATTTDTVNSVKAKVQDITSSADATIKSSIDSVKEAASKCGAGKCGVQNGVQEQMKAKVQDLTPNTESTGW